jgi:hypothetical protein
MSDTDDDVLAEAKCGERTCVVYKYLLTFGLLVDYQSDGMSYDYTARYCYPNAKDAMLALSSWDGTGDPPGPWVKEKRSERLGPGALK